MQEEVESRTVTLVISAAKLTGRVLRAALLKYLAHRHAAKISKATAKPTGKQTLKELVGQNAGVSNIEVSDRNIKGFDRVARKYGVDYAIKKDSSGEIPKYLVFFKARDADALTAAFTEYTNRKTREKPSVIQLLRSLTPEIGRERTQSRGLER